MEDQANVLVKLAKLKKRKERLIDENRENGVLFPDISAEYVARIKRELAEVTQEYEALLTSHTGLQELFEILSK